VLAVTHSPTKAGLVGFARLLPHALFGLLAGVAADRWNRKRLMLAADSVRALTLGAFAVAILAGRVAFWQIPIVGFVEGAGTTLFFAAQQGALRAVVPARQLPAAIGVRCTRVAAVQLGGPPLGGALFGLGRSLPFLVDTASYAFSFLSILAIRTPFQEPRERTLKRLRAEIREGLHFLWAQPFQRTTAFLYGLGNFLMPGVLLVLVVVGRRQGLSGGAVGASLVRSELRSWQARSLRRSSGARCRSARSSCSSSGRGSGAGSSLRCRAPMPCWRSSCRSASLRP